MALDVIRVQLPDIDPSAAMMNQRYEDNWDTRQPRELQRDVLFTTRLEALRTHYPADFRASAIAAFRAAMEIIPTHDNPAWSSHYQPSHTPADCDRFAREAYVELLGVACEVVEMLE